MIATDVGRALLLSTIPLASALAVLRIELVCVVALLVGALSLMLDLAHLAFVPALVTREHLVDGNSKLETTTAAAQVVSPGLGGALIGLLGAPFAILLDAQSLVGQWMAVTVYYIDAVSLRQSITPDRLQGRVNATIRFFAGGVLPRGALAGGALGGVIGLPMTLVAAELGTLLGFVWLVFSPVRALRTLPIATT